MACITWAYVVFRSVLVPVTHDEAMTFFTYVETGDFLPFRAHWDAGNHLLCTALAWYCYKLFGFQLWALRLPSVLAFVLYAFYAWRWGRMLNNVMVRWCLWAALLLMPFMLDFFSLFRGYALAMAFWTMALFHVISYVHRGGRMHILATLGAMLTASFAALSLATIWAFVLVVLAVFVPLHEPTNRTRAGSFLAIFILGIAPLIFVSEYLGALASRDLLYFGMKDGLINGTLWSVLRAMFRLTNTWAIGSIVLIAVAVFVVALRAWRTDRSATRTALMLLCGLLIGDVCARIVLHAWKGTLYPEDRTALQWVVLFVLALAIAIDRSTSIRPAWRFAALSLLILPTRTLLTSNTGTTSYWPEQAIPSSVFRAVSEEQRSLGRPITIGAYHQMPGCWAFGMRQRGLMLNAVDVVDFPRNDCDQMLVDPLRDAPYPEGYHAIADAGTHRQFLLARDHPLHTRLVVDSTIARTMNDDEFTELWHPSPQQAHGHRYLVQVDAVLNSEAAPLLAHLVSETNRANDKSHYEDVPLQFIRGEWHGDTLRLVRNVPSVPMDADRCVIYLWNEARSNYSVAARLRVFIVDE